MSAVTVTGNTASVSERGSAEPRVDNILEVCRRVSGIDKYFTSIDVANQYYRKLPKWLRAYRN